MLDRRTTAAVPLTIAFVVAGAIPGLAAEAEPATTLHDVSGLAPLGPGMAVATHDAKHPHEDGRPRLSLLATPVDPAGVTWQAISVDWADLGRPSSDLESASGIPGSSYVLLAESGDDASEDQRLYLADVDASASDGPSATIVAQTEWPGGVFNVEGMAVGEVNGQLVLLWAECAKGEPTTTIELASLTLDPFVIGEPTGVDFTSPAVRSENDRPISAMEVSSDGLLHVAAAFDTGDDAGPFSSSVWAAGLLVEGDDGPVLELLPEPSIVAFADGYKIESLAVLESTDGSRVLWFGTDDEDFGGTIRPLPSS